MNRNYQLEVVAKHEGTNGYGSIMLQLPRVDAVEVDINRPWWIDHTLSGGPVSVHVTPEEMAEVEVGTRFSVSLLQILS